MFYKALHFNTALIPKAIVLTWGNVKKSIPCAAVDPSNVLTSGSEPVYFVYVQRLVADA
jgi:hypothetical protein